MASLRINVVAAQIKYSNTGAVPEGLNRAAGAAGLNYGGGAGAAVVNIRRSCSTLKTGQ